MNIRPATKSDIPAIVRLLADDPFFKIFWEAIREGLIDVAKR